MGSFAKNPIINQHNSVMPVGPTAEREPYPKSGSFRFNTDAVKLEMFDGVKWIFASIAGLVAVVKDTFSGDATTVDFIMSRTVVNEGDVVVFVGNVHQNPGVAYTVDGTNKLSFTSPPPSNNTIVVLHGLNSTSA